MTYSTHIRNYRWLACWAVLALVLNQTAVAAHVCLPMADGGRVATTAAHATDLRARVPNLPMLELASVAPACAHANTAPDNNFACQMHCTHPSDSNQQGDIYIPLPLAGTIAAPAFVAPQRYAVLRSSNSDPTARKAARWRLHAFCTLLI